MLPEMKLLSINRIAAMSTFHILIALLKEMVVLVMVSEKASGTLEMGM